MIQNELDFAAIAADRRRSEEIRQECLELNRVAEMRLLSRAESNTKLRKSMRTDYRIASLSLAHHKTSGHNTCPQASAGCSAACVGGENVGMAQVFGEIMAGRIRRTKYLFGHRQAFVRQLIGEIEANYRYSQRHESQLCVRLNCFSDLPWHEMAFGCIPQLFPMVQFWDYSKCHSRYGSLPENWHITWSWSELARHKAACERLLHCGQNVAMAFSEEGRHTGRAAQTQRLPSRWKVGGDWFQVIDGDNGTGPGCGDEPHFDLRFLDPRATRSGRGRIVGLRLKSGNTVSRELAIQRGFSEGV
jgi:hypothetical protein